MEEARKGLLQWARGREQRGHLEDAAKGYVEADAPEEAARVLSTIGRFLDAGQILLRSIGYERRRTVELDAAQRKVVIKAAGYFALGQDLQQAVDLLLAIGERQRALNLVRRSGHAEWAARIEAEADWDPLRQSGAHAQVREAEQQEREGQLAAAGESYLRLGRLADAARVAEQRGDHREGAALFAKAGRPFESALCYEAAGALAECMAQLVQVPRAHPRYRDACVLAINVAGPLDDFVASFDMFVADFVATGPANEGEHQAFYALGALYERHGLRVEAADCYRKLLVQRPGYRDVGTRLEAVEMRIRRSGPRGTVTDEEPSEPTLLASRIGRSSTPAPRSAQSSATGGEASFAEGTRINERYEIRRKIGEGGMSAVYEAFDHELEESLAIKFFSAAWSDEATLARFKQEVTLSRKFNHPNVIRLYDIGSHGGFKYITMELLDGATLQTLMNAGKVTFWMGLDLLIQACQGLQRVHDQGVVHRDVKPDNFFVTDEGVLKVMDFGIAKRQTPKRALTLAGMMAGTPQYMAPEQINNFAAVTHLADLYALGCIAYELFTGARPFHHEELQALLIMQLNETPRPPRELNPQIPPELEGLVLRLLDKDPERRFPTCRALAEALAGIAAAPPGRD